VEVESIVVVHLVVAAQDASSSSLAMDFVDDVVDVAVVADGRECAVVVVVGGEDVDGEDAAEGMEEAAVAQDAYVEGNCKIKCFINCHFIANKKIFVLVNIRKL
jgi:hypothetical protein